jgi:hypothetical protein
LEGAIALTRWTLAQTRLLFADFGQGENPQAVKLSRLIERFRGAGWITARQISRWYYPPISAPEARDLMDQVVKLGYASSNGEEPSSKRFQIQIVTDNPDKSPQLPTLQGIEVFDKFPDKPLTNPDNSLTRVMEPDDLLLIDGLAVEKSVSHLSGNVSENVSGFVSESEYSNGKSSKPFVRVVSDFGKEQKFKTGDRIRVIQGRFVENYQGLVLPIDRITPDGIACRTPEGRLTTWLNSQDLELVEERLA